MNRFGSFSKSCSERRGVGHSGRTEVGVTRLNGVMPWCTSCDRFLSPSTVPADGACPSCGRPVDPGRAHVPTSSPLTQSDSLPTTSASPSAAPTEKADAKEHAAGERAAAVDEDETSPLPWHLWLLLAALTVYLGYRAFQGLEWVFGL